jgi:diguanylate cyclase (GGDEF)-like protein
VDPISDDNTLAQQLGRAFSLFGILVAAGWFVVAFTYGASAFWLTPAAQRGRDAVEAEKMAHAAMLDEENGARAYLLSHDMSFLEPYFKGVTELARANQAVIANAGTGSELAASVISTRLAEERWHERWLKAAVDPRPGAVAPSMLEGKALFDAYRKEELGLADALARRSEILTGRDASMTITRVVLVLAIYVVILFLAVRQYRALRASIVTPVAALLAYIGCVRDGRLDKMVDPDGPRELRQLGEGLNEMVAALAGARGSAESRDEAIREHSIRLRQILDASREFSESLNLSYVVGSVRESTAAVGGYERVIVWLMDDLQKRLVNAEEGAPVASANEPSEKGLALAARAAKSGRITFEGPAGQVRFSDSNRGPVRAIAIPLIVGARVVGALEARHGEPKVATIEVIEVLEMLAIHAATAIESARLHEVIEDRSHTDSLTRLFNRRRLEEDLDAECKRCARYLRPLAFVMLDVDHFKAFNDAHGHPRADVVLQEVAEVISGCVRTTDTAYRYGGEEFCILLRETTAEDGMHLAERIRQRIELRFASGATPGVTASFGVSEFSVATPLPRELVEAADAAMYESKHAGRNRVMLSSRPPFLAAPALSLAAPALSS